MSEALVQVFILYLLSCIVLYGIGRFLFKIKGLKGKAILVICVLLVPFALYIPTEVKTSLYGEEFSQIQLNTGFNLPIIYYKVFSISKTSAKLFVVEGEDGIPGMGNFYWLEKEDNQWRFTGKWQTVWSNMGGSASEFTIPPYF